MITTLGERPRRRQGRCLVFVWALLACGIARVRAETAFNDYAAAGSFALPVGVRVFDVLADGRIIGLADDEVYVETAVGSRVFAVQGMLPNADIAGFGPAFLRVSPNGGTLAVGNNGGSSLADFDIGVFDTLSLSGTWFRVNHFDAEWYDNRHLAVTAGDFGNPSFVTLLDTQSSDPLNPTNPMIVANIGGASAGITFDTAGNLYTGNGFGTSGPSDTGALKVFGQAAWQAALQGSPLDFENSGVLVIDLLSASYLGFDPEANLYLGGGDFISGELDFGALVRSSAVVQAVQGGGLVDPDDPALVRRFDPDTANDSNFYTVNHNAVTRELYFQDSSAQTVHVFEAPPKPAPAVSSRGLITIIVAIVCIGSGLIQVRRRNMLS